MGDWSLDENTERLREASRGNERQIATSSEGYYQGLFMADCGPGQYSHFRFADWMIENYPDRVAAILGFTP